MPFELQFSSHSAKFLKKAEKALYERIVEKLKKLADYRFPTHGIVD